MTTIWRMIVHHIDRTAAMHWTRANRRIAIGWGNSGEVRNYATKADLKSALPALYPPPHPNNSKSGSESLWSFCHDVQIGDLIILSGNKGRELVVEVVGDYEFVAQKPPLYGEYNHQRAIELTQYDGDKLWRAAGGLEADVSVYRTLVRCRNSVELSEL